MMAQLFGEMMKRRIPHILGMYVAAVWLCVEIADWMSERFPVSEALSSYVFVILLSLAPAVGLLAWGHGRPGKDQWTKTQAVVIVLNLILAVMAAWYWVKQPQEAMPSPPEKPAIQHVMATKTLVLEDEFSGQSVTYEVPEQGMSQKVSMSLWPNQTGDESLDWLESGAVWMLGKDLNRTPLISVHSPLSSDSMRQAIQNKGYDGAVKEPLTVSMQVAQKRSSQWLVRGEISKDENEVAFKAELYNVLTGAMVKSVTHRHSNWLTALDSISKELSEVVLEQHPDLKQKIPDLSIQDHISSDLSAIQSVVKAVHAVAFDNDYEVAKASLLEALERDPNMAEAHMLQMKMHANSGKFGEAVAAARTALSFDHKLYGEDVFEVKARLYGMTGEEDKALRVLENWTKVYPESVSAWLSLANNLMIKGDRLDDAAHAFEQLRGIEPGSKHLLRLSQVHVLRSDFESATKALLTYLEHEPESANATMSLGNIKLREGKFDEAKGYFESAELMVNGDLMPEISLARIEMVVGDVAKAEANLLKLLERAKSDNDQLMVLGALEWLYLQKGQITKGLEINDESAPMLKATSSPISYLLNYYGKKIGYLASLGEVEAAKALVKELEEKTEPPFDQMLVFMKLSYHSMTEDQVGLEKNLAVAKEVLRTFNMSIYQQFINNYEGMVLRMKGDFEQALVYHDLAIKQSSESILALSVPEILLELKRQKVKTLMAMEAYDEAMQLLDEMALPYPRVAENELLRAEVLHLMGEDDQAKAVILRVEDLWRDADTQYIEYQRFLQLKAKLS